MEYVYINRTTNLFKRQTEFLIKIATLDELDWELLAGNPNAITILENNVD